MDLIERVKAECDRNLRCKTCKLVKSNGRCSLPDTPSEWDIEAIRKALGGEIDGTVVGEEKSCTRVDGAVESVVEEIVVPKKWSKGFPEVVAEEPKEAVVLLFEQQNEIIDCLEKIKERVK